MAESAESMTSYQYAGDNPVMSNDPMGNLLVNPIDYPDYYKPLGLHSLGGGGSSYMAAIDDAGPDPVLTDFDSLGKGPGAGDPVAQFWQQALAGTGFAYRDGGFYSTTESNTGSNGTEGTEGTEGTGGTGFYIGYDEGGSQRYFVSKNNGENFNTFYLLTANADDPAMLVNSRQITLDQVLSLQSGKGLGDDDSANTASDGVSDFINGTGNLIGLKSVVVTSLLGSGLYENASGEIKSFTSLAKFKPGVSLAEQGNLSKAFTEFRSSGTALTWASRGFSFGIVAWDVLDNKPSYVTEQDGVMWGIAEIPFIGPPTATFLWLNSFIPESPSSNFANPGREPGHYAEWLH